MPLALNGSGAVTGLASLAGTLAWSAGTLRVDAAELLTSQTTTSTSYTDLGTVGPAVTITTGTKALVILTAVIDNSSSGNRSNMGFAVSGASTIAATDKWSISLISTGSYVPQMTASGVFLVTGLTAGSNTFTAKYRSSNAAATARFDFRQIAVMDMGS